MENNGSNESNENKNETVSSNVTNHNDGEKKVIFTNPAINKKANEIIIDKYDIKLILNILNVCSKRGAFQLEEFKIIGELNDKLKLLNN
jgi:hypothetical protein